MPSAVISLPKFQDDEDDVFASLWRGGVSEFFATMIFVFIGTGAVVASKTQLGSNVTGVSGSLDVSGLLVVALAHGFAIMVLVYAVGEVS